MNALKYLCMLSLCLLTACASHQVTQEAPTNESQNVNKAEPASEKIIPKGQASQATSWEISGAMAARNKNKGWTATVNWVQQGPHHYQIRLFGPLGGGTVMVERNDGVVTYVDGPKKATSHNADKLLLQQTGIMLPVQNLYYWVRGLPAPGAVGSAHYDQSNHLMFLSQAGYTIHYSGYTSVGHLDLPSKIHLQGHGVLVKLIIKHWKV